MTVTGSGYEITVAPRRGVEWVVYGTYGDLEIDSLWCDVDIRSFDEADSLVLEVIGGNDEH